MVTELDRILIIAGKLHIGGAEKVCRDIALYADPERFRFDYVVYGRRVGEYEGQLEAMGCRIFHLPEPSEGYIRHIRALKGLMAGGLYHAVHGHSMFNCGWAMWVAKRCKIPVRIAHAHSALKERRSLARRVYEAGMRMLILRCATDLAACSEAAGRRLFGGKQWEKRGLWIPNGVDSREFAFRPDKRDEMRKKLHLEGKRVLGHMGHLSAVKNQTFLLELMPEVLKREPGAVLLLLGEGEDRPALEEKIRTLALSDNVILTGNVTNVGDCLSAMDVFVFPSLYEGMPLAVLEAQANGLPCVLSEGVPGDVIVTESVSRLSLRAPKEVWAERILSSTRGEASICEGCSAQTARNRIYGLYDRRNVT